MVAQVGADAEKARNLAVLVEMLNTGKNAAQIIQARGLGQVSDSALIAGLVGQVLQKYPQELASYLSGLGGALWLAPAIIRERAAMRSPGSNTGRHLWDKILESEEQARKDFAPSPTEQSSLFLKWYFRIFRDCESQVSGRRLQA